MNSIWYDTHTHGYRPFFQDPITLFFIGRMPFLPPNQQRQSTESNMMMAQHNIQRVELLATAGPKMTWSNIPQDLNLHWHVQLNEGHVLMPQDTTVFQAVCNGVPFCCSVHSLTYIAPRGFYSSSKTKFSDFQSITQHSQTYTATHFSTESTQQFATPARIISACEFYQYQLLFV